MTMTDQRTRSIDNSFSHVFYLRISMEGVNELRLNREFLTESQGTFSQRRCKYSLSNGVTCTWVDWFVDTHRLFAIATSGLSPCYVYKQTLTGVICSNRLHSSCQ